MAADNNSDWEDITHQVPHGPDSEWEDVTPARQPGSQAADPYAAYMQQERQQPALTRLKHVLVGDPKSPVVDGGAPLALPAEAVPALGKAAEWLNSSAPKRILAAGAQGAASDPEHPVMGGLKGAAMAAVPETLAGLLGKTGDAAMQFAVERKKFTPGLGTDIANEGVWGTKAGMQTQVGNKLNDAGQQIHDLVDQIPGRPIDAKQIASNIASDSQKPFTIPDGGVPSAADKPKLDAIGNFAQDVADRGIETAPQALQRRIAAGTRGYKGKENPLASLLGDLSSKEQQGYSSALKDAYREAAPSQVPEGGLFSSPSTNVKAAEGISTADPEALARADKSYSVLKKAQKGVDEETSIPQGLWGAMHNIHYVPGSSLGSSIVGQGLVKGSQAIDALNNPILRQILLNKSSQDGSGK